MRHRRRGKGKGEASANTTSAGWLGEPIGISLLSGTCRFQGSRQKVELPRKQHGREAASGLRSAATSAGSSHFNQCYLGADEEGGALLKKRSSEGKHALMTC